VSVITRERALTLLTDLIALPSVNPMERKTPVTEPVEKNVADYIEALFRPYGVEMVRERVAPAHENLLIAIPGRDDLPATLFESHMDTVPADDWSDRAFTPRVEGEIVYGRGACDDKGPLVSMILAALDILERGTAPPAPVLLLAAGDEEYAQLGIRYFREKCLPVGRGVFGEPTSLIPIVQHKGTLRWDITVHGRSAHTSRPELGVNAIEGMIQVIAEIAAHQEELRRRFTSPMITGPSLTVTMIRGGRTRNAVPDECVIALDFRLLPGMDLPACRAELIARLDRLGLSLSHGDLQIQTPPLNTDPDDPFSLQVLEICRRHAGSGVQLEGVPYGTDAAWISDRAPALVLGPGSIATAHAVDEQIDIREVVACAEIYRDILMADCAGTG
jgi:acetylornithine deacetylase